MKNKIMNRLQTGLIALATIVLIDMNVTAYNSVALNVLRAILASCLIGIGVLHLVNHTMKTQKTES